MMMLVLSCFGDGYADTDNLTASAADKETIIHVLKEQGHEDEPYLELDDISRGIAVAIETVASTLGNECGMPKQGRCKYFMARIIHSARAERKR